ncbi:MAG: SAM-dependent methyltransferase [Chloroflexota bacterium]
MSSTFILTANPQFIDLALEEMQKAAPQAKAVQTLADGVLGIGNADFFDVAEPWRQQKPIFVRHICPIYETLPLTGQHKDIVQLERLVKREFAELVDPELPFSVQTRLLDKASYKPFAVNTALANAIQTMTGAILDVQRPLQILAVVIADGVAYLGLSLVVHNLSDWAGGVRRFAREEGQISRAEFKLLEALEVFQIHLPPNGIALDLGAAPGGWTRVLRQREQYVTAVDPGNLHASLRADKSVRHKRMLAETYLAELPDRYDLIVNDMRLDARDSARLMVDYAPYLYRHGGVVMTFKLPEKKREAVLDHAFNILKKAYVVAGARQLFHNRSEITVYLRLPGR